MSFKSIFEERDSSEYGLYASGDVISVYIKQAKFNNLMELEITGKKTLPKLKSSETTKNTYREEDWGNIEKLYKKLFEKQSGEVEKLVKKFEKDLFSIIQDIEKETNKF